MISNRLWWFRYLKRTTKRYPEEKAQLIATVKNMLNRCIRRQLKSTWSWIQQGWRWQHNRKRNLCSKNERGWLKQNHSILRQIKGPNSAKDSSNTTSNQIWKGKKDKMRKKNTFPCGSRYKIVSNWDQMIKVKILQALKTCLILQEENNLDHPN